MDKVINTILSFLMAILLATLILFLWGIAPVKADTEKSVASTELVCSTHEDLTGQLKVKYNEIPIGIGVVKGKENVLELLVSPQKTWSILVTYIRGENRTCLVAHGEMWQYLRAVGLTPS